MIVKEIQIENFKSIGTDYNNLVFEEDITTLVGRNGTGKSNILESLMILNEILLGMNDNKPGKPNENPRFSILLECKKSSNTYNIIIDSKYKYPFIADSDIKKETDFTRLLQDKKNLVTTISAHIKGVFEEYNLKDNISILENFQDELSEYEQDFIVPGVMIKSSGNYEDLFDFIKYICEPHELENLIGYYMQLLNVFREIDAHIPAFFLLKPQYFLKDKYNIRKLNEMDLDKHFSQLLMILDLKIDLFTISNLDLENMEKKKEIENNINQKLEKFIVIPFNRLYNKDISLNVSIIDNFLSFFITENDKTLKLNETNSGLLQLLNLFIQCQFLKHNTSKPLVILLDEPNNNLHIETQKKLLNFLNRVANSGIQVLLATHSPYMINSDELGKLRTISKNDKFKTEIHPYQEDWDLEDVSNEELMDDVTTPKVIPISEKERVKPVVQTLEEDKPAKFEPSPSANNIIVEHPKDALFLQYIYDHSGIKQSIQFIPAGGIAKIDSIISVLVGWDYSFKVVLDYDNMGTRKVTMLRRIFDLKLGRELFFINGILPRPLKIDVTNNNVRRIEDLIEYKILDESLDPKEIEDRELDIPKLIKGLEANQIQLSNKTISHFNKLLKILTL